MFFFFAIMHVRSVIEDIAILIRPSRESDEVGRRVCIEHDCFNE